MRLLRLRLTNFRQHAATDIEFGSGITGIIGPNGSGKTTLLEAIAWAFYGTPAARGGRDSLRWNRAPARSAVRVEVEFTLGPHEHRVVRTLYGAELYLDRGAEPVANSGQEVTKRVQRVLGMTREEFFNTYFTGQKELAVMATMGPTERGKFLSRILGYERLRVAQDRLREVRSALRGELQGLEHGLGDPEGLERERAEAETRCRDAAAAVRDADEVMRAARERREAEGPAWTEMVRLREAVLALTSDRRVAEKEVEEARREFERLDRELAEALKAQAALKELEPTLADVAPLRAELERLERDARQAGQRRQLAGQLAERAAQREQLGERLRSLGDVAAAAQAAQATVGEAREALAAAEREEERVRTEWVRNRQDAETKRLTLRDQYRDLQEHRERIVTAGPDGACPTCARPLGNEYEAVLGTLTRQLEEIELNGKFFKQRVEQLAAEPEEVRQAHQQVVAARRAADAAAEALAQARAREREVIELRGEHERAAARVGELERQVAVLPEQYDVDRHDAVRARLRELEPAVTRAAELRVKAERAEQLVRDAEGAERTLSAREARLAELDEAVAALGFSEERFEAARTAYEAAETAVRDAEVIVLTRRHELKAAETALEAAVRRLAERAERVARADAVRTETRVHDELDDALGDLRTELNAQLRPELSEIASAFLADLTDGRYHELELDDQYRILVLEEGEPKPVISGGEEDVANLVLRLAISQMVAERAGQPLSLLVLDEIFGSLDEGRRQHVVGLLRRLADRFPQVILITHIESVRDSVDRVLRLAVDPTSGAAVVAEEPGGRDEDVAA
jgi:exonuclease SbcC